MRISDWSSDVCSSDLFAKARVHCGDSPSVRYQRSDKASSGNTRKLPGLSDSGMTARIGSMRKAKTSAQKPGSAKRQNREKDMRGGFMTAPTRQGDGAGQRMAVRGDVVCCRSIKKKHNNNKA